MGDYWTNAVRHPEDVGVGHIKRIVNFDMAALSAGNGLPIGALEAGAVPLLVHVTVITLFNGTSPTLVVGTTADDDGFATSVGIAPGTAGFKPNLVGALSGVALAANTIVYAKLGGSGWTTGKANVILTFVNKRELEGIPTPAN
jgi:hypothetical protein